MANFWPFGKCQKCTGIFEIFGRPFLRKFWVFSGTIETVKGTHCLTKNSSFLSLFASFESANSQNRKYRDIEQRGPLVVQILSYGKNS